MIIASIVVVWITSLVVGAMLGLGATTTITGKPPLAFIAKRGYSTGEWRMWGLSYFVVGCALAANGLAGGLFLAGVLQSGLVAQIVLLIVMIGFFAALGLIDQHHHRRWPFTQSRRAVDVSHDGPRLTSRR
ncbi:MAG TPA: hypothetical protein VG426_10085 [Candidatus Dormibacteraeota bacterium]|nr:hypothetical protein [Candidatus Dormibacteraeota bacterium]